MNRRHQVDYTREEVTRLLECMWGGWVVEDEYRPDLDMPKAKANPARQGNDMAHRLDIQRAWTFSKLSLDDKAAVWMSIRGGWTHQQIAIVLEIPKSTVGYRIDRAIGVLVAVINGKTYNEESND